jgi:hypothetical protein
LQIHRQVLEMALHVLSMNGIRFSPEEFLGKS